MLNATACPSHEALEKFLAEDLREADRAAIEAHVGACEACQRSVEDLCAGPDLRRWAMLSNDSTLFEPGHEATPASHGEAPADEPPAPRRTEKGQPILPAGALGQYELCRVLGRGGMGMVFEARHTKLKRRVALKVLAADHCDHRAVQRFQQEMAVVGQLQHPHIVQAHDAGEVGGHHFLVMELLDGRDLEKVARALGPLAVADVCEMIRQAALGLQHAHDHGLIHRDIKPSNLLLTRDGVVKVADLGLARAVASSAAEGGLTSRNCFVGTADYAAPEQAQAKRPIDARVDLYGLGCAMYRLLTGRPPFIGPRYDTPMRKLLAHANDPVPPVTNFRDDAPAGVIAILNRLLAKSAEQRFPSAATVAAELAPYAAEANLAALGANAAALGESPEASLSEAEQNWLRSIATDKSQSTTAKIWRSRLKRQSVAVVLTLGLVSLTLLLAAMAAPRRPIVYERLSKEEVRRQVEYPLLNVEPARLSWREDGKLHLAKNELQVITSKDAFLTLGDAPFDSYELEIELRQRRWAGGAGVFFGAEEIRQGEAPLWSIECIHLEQRPTGAEDYEQFPFRLVHTSFLLRPIEGRHLLDSYSEASIRVPMPHALGAKLRLQVLQDRLVRVEWNGVECADLCQRPTRVRGAFGVYGRNSSTEFQNARIRIP